MMMKVRALSSEGRMTAIMLTVLPVFAFTVLFLLNPASISKLRTIPSFVPGFVGADRAVFHRVHLDPANGRFEGLTRCLNCSPKIGILRLLLLLLLFAWSPLRPISSPQAIAARQLTRRRLLEAVRGTGADRNARRRFARSASKAPGSSWSTQSRSRA